MGTCVLMSQDLCLRMHEDMCVSVHICIHERTSMSQCVVMYKSMDVCVYV